jgi:hypothetical protein
MSEAIFSDRRCTKRTLPGSYSVLVSYQAAVGRGSSTAVGLGGDPVPPLAFNGAGWLLARFLGGFHHRALQNVCTLILKRRDLPIPHA